MRGAYLESDGKTAARKAEFVGIGHKLELKVVADVVALADVACRADGRPAVVGHHHVAVARRRREGDVHDNVVVVRRAHVEAQLGADAQLKRGDVLVHEALVQIHGAVPAERDAVPERRRLGQARHTCRAPRVSPSPPRDGARIPPHARAPYILER